MRALKGRLAVNYLKKREMAFIIARIVEQSYFHQKQNSIVDFWGNELTLHASEHKLDNERHDVDMGNVSVPHFGVHLSRKDFVIMDCV